MQEPFELRLEIHPRPMQSRSDRAELELERRRDLLVREALKVAQDDHDAPIFGSSAIARWSAASSSLRSSSSPGPAWLDARRVSVSSPSADRPTLADARRFRHRREAIA